MSHYPLTYATSDEAAARVAAVAHDDRKAARNLTSVPRPDVAAACADEAARPEHWTVRHVRHRCHYCGRGIVHTDADGWIDPTATGDDAIWREVCDSHDTVIADHVPAAE